MAFQVKDLMVPISLQGPCGPISVDTGCLSPSAFPLDCGFTAEPTCGGTSCAFDSARLSAVSEAEGDLHRLRQQLTATLERGAFLLN